MELVRSILLAMEASDDPTTPVEVNVPGHRQEEVAYHVMLLAQAGLADENATGRPTEEAIRADPVLSPEQKDALLTVYRSYLLQQERREAPPSE